MNRRLLIAAATALVVAVVVVAVIRTAGPRERTFDLSTVYATDSRIPKSVTVSVIESRTVRVTMASRQQSRSTSSTKGEDAYLGVVVSKTCDAGSSGTTSYLVSLTRKWGVNVPGKNGGPVDLIQRQGQPDIERPSRSTAGGSHVDLTASTAIPQGVCVRVAGMVGGANNIARESTNQTF